MVTLEGNMDREEAVEKAKVNLQNMSQWLIAKRRWRMNEIDDNEFIALACLLGRQESAMWIIDHGDPFVWGFKT